MNAAASKVAGETISIDIDGFNLLQVQLDLAGTVSAAVAQGSNLLL